MSCRPCELKLMSRGALGFVMAAQEVSCTGQVARTLCPNLSVSLDMGPWPMWLSAADAVPEGTDRCRPLLTACREAGAEVLPWGNVWAAHHSV